VLFRRAKGYYRTLVDGEDTVFADNRRGNSSDNRQTKMGHANGREIAYVGNFQLVRCELNLTINK